MKKIYNYLRSLFTANKTEFYYLLEEQQFEDAYDATRVKYLTSYDRAA